MYSTCIFCHSDLGKNESVEHFPVGRRLAFDAARGRLWVVCKKCERWNLTPLEERWEAIEECERLFSNTKRRVSTEHIGLAKLREGLELVRIGEPQRPEMAAWRYGDQFGKRRRRTAIHWAGAVAVGTTVALLGPVGGIATAGAIYGANALAFTSTALGLRRVRALIDVPGRDEPIPFRLQGVRDVRISSHREGWSIEVPFEKPRTATRQWITVFRGPRPDEVDRAVLTGDAALAAAGKILPLVNVSGGRRSDVATAVDLIERSGSAAALFQSLVQDKKVGYGKRGRRVAMAPTIVELSRDVKLALEMAAHEESERRALEGELHVLEAALQEAEEIAAISDSMFMPDEARAKLSELSDKREP